MPDKQILFLDDDHRRIAEIRARLETVACELVVVETAADCIRELGRRSFDLVMLDHDLGGEIFCDSAREDCGMEVVRWLKTTSSAHGAFIVHTMNPVAAAAMYLELSAMGHTVEQATFGSTLFYRNLHALLGLEEPPAPVVRKSLSDRINEYLRSIRSGGSGKG